MLNIRNAKRFEITHRTTYFLNDKGEGLIASTAVNLDNETDRVAQNIGFPIDHGLWRAASSLVIAAGDVDTKSMIVEFAVSDDAYDAWLASRTTTRSR